jgi:processive 1,2-diacylglycerol beta-glucosyltransferase
MKKILVVYASAGEGHKKAGFAVYEELRRQAAPDVQVTLVDSLDYTNRFFKFTYMMGYILLVKYTPTLWGLCYYLLDTRFFYSLIRPFRRLINWLNSFRFVNFLKNENFYLCVSTHFMSTEVIGRLKKYKKIDTGLITVITDFKSHFFWLTKYADTYIVASEDTKKDLICRGIARDKIMVYGIPIERKFSAAKDKAQVTKKLGLTKRDFTILVMGGGFGVGPIREIVFRLQKLKGDIQILVVCGRNKNLFENLSASKDKFIKPTFIYGFCDNMDEIMHSSDVMVSKVGGMASSESLASQLPIIAIAPIPGQEMRNAKFLLNNGVGFKIKNPEEAAFVISGLLSDKLRFSQLKERIAGLAKPNAAQDIARFALQRL